MKNKQLLAVAVSAAMSAQAMAEQEQHKQVEAKLDMVQVVGQATGGMNNLITSQQLENTQVNDMTDIFALNPQVSAGGAVALGQKVYVRNVGEDMLNVTVDGAAQSGGVFHHAGRVVIEPELLKQIEVEAGAGSATAGLGALGGAVRFVTKDPEDLLRGNETAGGTIKSTYFSNGESLKTSVMVYGSDSKGKISGLANIVHADFKNREDGAGQEIVGSESENVVGFFKGIANITDQQKLSISFETLNQEGDMLYRPEWIPSNKNPLAKTQANRKTVIANYNFNADNDLINLSVNAYQSTVEQLRGDNGEVDGSVETTGLTIENVSAFGPSKLIYGINYREDESQLTESGTPYDPENGEVMGLYAQSIISVTDQLTMTTGLRFDDYSLTDLEGQKLTSDGLSANLSANYAITPEVSVSAGYAEAMRGATVADSYVVYFVEYTDEEGNPAEAQGYKNDPDLKEERSKNIEIAAEYNSGPITASIGVYDNTIEDPIGHVYPEIWSKTNVNASDIETIGYFLKGGFEQGALSITAGFNSAKTEQNDIQVIRYAHGSTGTSIGDTLVVDVNYQLNSAWTLGWTGQMVSSLDPVHYVFTWNGLPDDGYTLEKEGYTTHDLYARWSPMIDDTLVVNLTVKNMLDENYLNHASPEDFSELYATSSGQNDPGRDIRVAIAYKF